MVVEEESNYSFTIDTVRTCGFVRYKNMTILQMTTWRKIMINNILLSKFAACVCYSGSATGSVKRISRTHCTLACVYLYISRARSSIFYTFYILFFFVLLLFFLFFLPVISFVVWLFHNIILVHTYVVCVWVPIRLSYTMYPLRVIYAYIIIIIMRAAKEWPSAIVVVRTAYMYIIYRVQI